LPVTALADDDQQSVVHIVDRHLEVAAQWRPGDPVVRARVMGASFTLQADPVAEGWLVRHGGAELRALVRSRRAAELAARIPEKVRADTGKMLRSPMPGLIVSIAVQPGEEVKAGQDLCILEAMKMENVLKAEQDGRVEEVRVRPRDTVAADQVLITFV
jgi:propionyl-CoA carboxylase alpha chain